MKILKKHQTSGVWCTPWITPKTWNLYFLSSMFLDLIGTSFVLIHNCILFSYRPQHENFCSHWRPKNNAFKHTIYIPYSVYHKFGCLPFLFTGVSFLELYHTSKVCHPFWWIYKHKANFSNATGSHWEKDPKIII